MYTIAIHDRMTKVELARHTFATEYLALLGRVDLLKQLVKVENRPVLITGILQP